jgi:hypothetical protein
VSATIVGAAVLAAKGTPVETHPSVMAEFCRWNRSRRSMIGSLWQYRSLSLANAETPIGGVPFRPVPLWLLNSNCGSTNRSSRQTCIPRQLSFAPSVSEIGIVAMSKNGSSQRGDITVDPSSGA